MTTWNELRPCLDCRYQSVQIVYKSAGSAGWASDSGGAVAQLFMAANPARVRTLLLANCDAEPDSPPVTSFAG